jgi:HAMP domain-containing protein
MNQETLLYVLVGFLVLAGILVLPLLYQLWRTAEQLTIALRTLNVEDITGNLNETTTNVNARVAEVSSALQRVHGFLSSFQSVNHVVGSKQGKPLRFLKNALPALKGVKTFFRVLNTSTRNPVQ